ncbi:putative reverse transcriptase zinc-binding domain-containing protein [Helianthus annuus]|uniref:uncharacterized protein LOC110943777 n=1 Tax=Helianthus annuus TaxID=4232 RepID=UPI000B907C3A|nr:uncharacterized protein LOC110943777 [Helianthus annuus]KAJ0585603.1 putative reverse transcriptase zinc-binding domain-containing protein [Helianthus annuus]KAJ0920185.1 putative reverse transcriptase zinc-binding domain-containing protein [Helianthus annuus]
MVTPRHMSQHGLSLASKLADIVENGTWRWPDEWRLVYPALFQLAPVVLDPNREDVVMIRNPDGRLDEYSTKQIWEAIRTRGADVPWVDFVWSAFNIPKHSFLCWLILKKKLWTQDRMLTWNHNITRSMNMICCLLCYSGVDSHAHLFFECKYSSQVWTAIRAKGSMQAVSEKWEDICQWMVPKARSKSVQVVSNKLLISATAYYVWQERNNRFFRNQLRPPEKLLEIIVQTVRLKLMSFKFKRSARVQAFLEDWKLEEADRFGND